MTARVLAVTPNTEFVDALWLMRTHRVHHLPVVDGGYCTGLVSETTLLTAFAAGAAHPGGPVGALRRCPAPTVRRGDSLGVVAAAMRDQDTDAVVVLDGSNLVGLITVTDILDAVAGRGAD